VAWWSGSAAFRAARTRRGLRRDRRPAQQLAARGSGAGAAAVKAVIWMRRSARAPRAGCWPRC
jgi:hypothetical protein